MRLLPQTRGPLFLVLNVLRALSILALVLVFSSTVVTIVDDIKAVKADKAGGNVASSHSSPSSSALEKRRRVLIIPPYTPPAESTATAGAIAPLYKLRTPPPKREVEFARVGPEATMDSWWYERDTLEDPETAPIAKAEPQGIVAVDNSRVFAEVPEPSVVSPTATQPNTIAPGSSAIAAAALYPASASTAAAPVYTCDYYKGSTVPLQAGGTFWSVLARVFILGECILLALSEIGFPAAFFANIIPMLGEEYGLGCLGVLQALIASSVLAHHCRRFAQVFAWLLFIVAMINVLVGIFFRDKAKQHRAMSWENAAELTPQTRAAAAAWNIGSSVHESVRDWRARNASATAARTEASRPSFYSQNTPAPTVAPTAAPTPGPGRKRFSWDTSPRWSGFPWGRQKEPPVISRPYETMPSV